MSFSQSVASLVRRDMAPFGRMKRARWKAPWGRSGFQSGGRNAGFFDFGGDAEVCSLKAQSRAAVCA